MLKKIMPMIYLLAVTAAVMTGLVLVQPGNPADETAGTNEYTDNTAFYLEAINRQKLFKSIQAEVAAAMTAVRRYDTAQNAKYFEPKYKDVLMHIRHMMNTKDGHIEVGIDQLNEDRIKAFNELFPYGCFVFTDASNLIATPT